MSLVRYVYEKMADIDKRVNEAINKMTALKLEVLSNGWSLNGDGEDFIARSQEIRDIIVDDRKKFLELLSDEPKIFLNRYYYMLNEYESIVSLIEAEAESFMKAVINLKASFVPNNNEPDSGELN